MTTRKFRGISTIFLQAASASGSGNGTQSGFSITSALDQYIGNEFVSDNYEQYKVTNVEVLMKPSATALTAPSSTLSSITYQNCVYSLMNSTYVQSFVDYDSDVNPSFNDCLSRPSLKTRALSPNNWTKIASFTPRTVSNQAASNTSPTNTFARHWMSTTNMDTKLFGLRGLISNPSVCFDTQDNVAAVDFRVTITVQMKGPKNTLVDDRQLATILFDAPIEGAPKEMFPKLAKKDLSVPVKKETILTDETLMVTDDRAPSAPSFEDLFAERVDNY